MEKKKIIISIFCLIVVSIILYFIFSFLLKDQKSDYNYENVLGHSFIASDNSYIIFNKDKTFYWYEDKENLSDNYYYGTYTIYRGENAVEYIAKDLAVYSVTEKEQRRLLENKSIDLYYNWNLKNTKLVINGEEQIIDKDTHFYGILSENYDVFNLVNMDAANYATFTLEK